jgi:pyruvate ferredoxin oxidoreductase beta subunit
VSLSDRIANLSPARQAAGVTGGNQLPPAHSRSVQSAAALGHSLDPVQRSCEGCGEALGARHAIGAAMRATGNRLITVSATGCHEASSTPFPDASCRLPWIHSLLGNAAAVATGVAAAQRIKGRVDVRVVAQGGDGGTADTGFGCLSGMFERNEDVLYICYDSEACMNSGAQRSSATPPAARTGNTPALGKEPGNASGTGKNLPLIATAHRIPYVATASVADLPDLERKVTFAMGLRGARYIHIHAPCPPGWGSAPADTIRIAQLAVESGLFPLFEAHDGRVTARTPLRHKVPVDEYLGLQTRFAHLFVNAASRERIALIQEIADRNVAEFNLLTEATE